MRRAMEERVAALGIRENFRFLGFRADSPRIVQAFDIIAVPSHVEPLGTATLEAMAAGRPVVGSRVGGIPEMVIDGTTCTLVPPKDPNSLAHALAALVGDDAMRLRMSNCARERSISAFGSRPHAENLQGHYDRLCGASRRFRTESRPA